jgi:hypothetical protein
MEGQWFIIEHVPHCLIYVLKIKYERECRQRELLQNRLIELEKDLLNRQQQSKLLAKLQVDIQRLHSAFDALEVTRTMTRSTSTRSCFRRPKTFN